jgi:inner membrane protein
VDNVCHTLVGAALGEAGLKHRTRYGNALLMVAANLPDLDVLVFATDVPAVAFRRGWTHGVLAQAVLPAALAAGVWAAARMRAAISPATAPRMDSRPGAPAGGVPPLRLPWLLLLSYVGLYSHVLLDYLNTYGVRLLAPIDWRWFYGDAVFIIDVWLWLSLGAGVWLARRMARPAPALGALGFAACYIAVMLMSARIARDQLVDVWRLTRGAEPRAAMSGPMPVLPFTRQVIVDAGAHYERGVFSWLTSTTEFDAAIVPKRDDAPEVARARAAANVRGFLVWSRFPYWELESTPDGTRVTVKDMRFGDRFAASTLVPALGVRAMPGPAASDSIDAHGHHADDR